MNLGIVPDHLPVIAARLDVIAAELMQMLGSVALVSIPSAPGADGVSACIPAAFGGQAGRVLPCTATGVAYGVNRAEKLPEVSAAFCVTDEIGSSQVLSNAVVVGK